MSSAISASGTANPQNAMTPFDQVLVCEEREEARVQAALEEMTEKERSVEQAMRDAEGTQEEKWRADAKKTLLEEKEAIGKAMEQQEETLKKERHALEEDAKKHAPAIITQQVATMLSPDFFHTAA